MRGISERSMLTYVYFHFALWPSVSEGSEWRGRRCACRSGYEGCHVDACVTHSSLTRAVTLWMIFAGRAERLWWFHRAGMQDGKRG